MAIIAVAAPILKGKQEAWRRFIQEMLDLRLSEYEESRSSLGIARESAWISQTPAGDMAILYIETDDPAGLVARLAASNRPFDRWFRAQMLELHGLPVAQSSGGQQIEMVFEWVSPLFTHKEKNEMSTEQNKSIVRRAYDEFFNGGNLAVAQELFAPGYVHHDANLPPEMQNNRDAYLQGYGMFPAAFPDLAITVDDLIAEGDKVVVRWSFRGTNTGPFMGMPPTGKSAAVGGVGIYRLQDNSIVEGWYVFDAMGMMQQLGTGSAPDTAVR